MKTINDILNWCSEKSGRTFQFTNDSDGKWWGYLQEECAPTEDYYQFESKTCETIEATIEELFKWIKEQEEND